ncbi:MAG: shikimate dehydrogenase [Myxococcales bacterium]|nr:shikimate dehydrogenase [Myxococcales bacterium]
MTRRLAAVLGWPIEHSRSPAMHDAAFAAVGLDAVMVPLPVRPERLADAVRGLAAVDALGASVTVPHKAAVAALCDEQTPLAVAIGAVNCLAFVDGEVVGHNTDAGGFVDGLRAAAVPLDARPALVLGAGGAARAVVAGLAAAGVATIVVARRPAEVAWTAARPWAELAALLPRAGIVVDCTSAGLDPAADAALAASVPLAAAAADATVATLVYHRPTALLRAAAARGLATVDGRAMLLHQATRAFAIWTGHPAPTAIMRAALDASLGR